MRVDYMVNGVLLVVYTANESMHYSYLLLKS